MLQIDITMEKYLSYINIYQFVLNSAMLNVVLFLYEKSILESLVSKKSDYLESSWPVLSLVLISSQITGHALDGDVEIQDIGLGLFYKTS